VKPTVLAGESADVVVIGTGAAGLSAALTAHAAGFSVIMLERSDLLAGTTALAGGGIWAPANRFMLADGDQDSAVDALRYLEAVVGDQGPATSTARKRAFVENVPKAIAFLESLGVRFRRTPGYPDYHPDQPGASVAGRGVESVVFDMSVLGDWNSRFLQRPFPRTMPMGTLDVARLVLARRTLAGALTYARVFTHFVWGKITRRRLRAGGSALAGQLLHQVRQRGIPVMLLTGATDLMMDGERVAGVIARGPGGVMSIRAGQAVVLAAGGFARSAELREKYQPAPVTGAWTSASKSDLGDGIRLGQSAGAALSLMDEAWWGPASVLPNGVALFHVSERSKPGSLIVDAAGRRYMNEAMSYVDAGHAMFEANSNGQAIPSWMIFDQAYRSHYPFGTLLPGITPQELVDKGYFRRAGTLEELAGMIGVESAVLRATVERFNGFARSGVDEDFGRGGNPYDRYFGDPRVKPNPCLAPVERAPFYAVALYPGDLGTKGGLVTDEHARVLREDGSVIRGLYAAGNTTASVMGRRYPGPGVTLGPAITFGHLAMRHLAETAGATQATMGSDAQ
jgi:3-oxosteroid 1-dehydrogenase